MRIKLIVCVALSMLCCSVSYGNTLTFDDVTSGTVLWYSDYANNNRILFSQDFRATDHTGSAWGLPHSGSNVLSSVGNPYINPFILFGLYYPERVFPDHIESVGAYFSAKPDVMVRITAYRTVNHELQAVTSVVIGESGQPWSNRYVEIAAPSGLEYQELHFEGVNGKEDLLGFCLDDMTITPVPEPSSLLALSAGLLPFAGMTLRRRR